MSNSYDYERRKERCYDCQHRGGCQYPPEAFARVGSFEQGQQDGGGQSNELQVRHHVQQPDEDVKLLNKFLEQHVMMIGLLKNFERKEGEV